MLLLSVPETQNAIRNTTARTLKAMPVQGLAQSLANGVHLDPEEINEYSENKISCFWLILATPVISCHTVYTPRNTARGRSFIPGELPNLDT